jgi:hypothetical protein
LKTAPPKTSSRLIYTAKRETPTKYNHKWEKETKKKKGKRVK